MPNLAQIGAGIAKGAAGIEERTSRLQEARNRRDLSQLKLQDYQQQAPVRESQQELEMQQLKNQLRQSQSTGMQQMTYNAFTAFDSDGATRHLNNFLRQAKQNPMGAKMFNDVVRYDDVTNTPENVNRLKQLGITDIDGFFEDPRKAGNYVLATGVSGEQKLVDMDKVYASTGYARTMEQQKLKDLETRALINQRMRSGETKSNITARERVAKQMAEKLDIPFHEAYQKLGEGSARTGSTETERLATRLREDNPDLSYIDSMDEALSMKRAGSSMEREASRIADEEKRDYNEVFEELKTEKARTTAQKSFEEVQTVKDQLDKDFGGDFLSADLSDAKQRSKAGRLIARIEKDFPLKPKERAVITEIRQLAGLAAVAGEEITDAEAGPLDSIFRDVRKYISNEVTGIKGTAAYEAFRNTMKHALFGATQSAGEMKSFQKAAGSLVEQLGPVLVKFRTQIEELKTKLNSVYDLGDDYVAKFHLGMDRDKIAQVINALDERIEMLDTVKVNKSAKVLTPGKKKTVSEYFK